MKHAAALLKDKKIAIQGYSETTVGMSMLDGSVFTASESDFVQLGKNIIEALAQCRVGIPHPTAEDYKRNDKEGPMLSATGTKNWSILMKISKRVEIRKKDNIITFLPTRFRGLSGPNKGYEDFNDRIITIENQDPETLGRALVKAFSLCE